MDLQARIRELAKAGGIEMEHENDRCWVDGRVRCPYGFPEGQYVLRPELYCHASEGAPGTGCATYDHHVLDPEIRRGIINGAIATTFNDLKVTLSSELRAHAEQVEEKAPVEAKALELAADIIEELHRDRNIMLEDDLPK